MGAQRLKRVFAVDIEVPALRRSSHKAACRYYPLPFLTQNTESVFSIPFPIEVITTRAATAFGAIRPLPRLGPISLGGVAE
jgi:hypothetical protein